ncbi:hypothetical protein J6590_081331 [Homalodisca vitripennis]|nr:hypothetical protein J6590_081331 [Homalodisca vitripennis]
MALLRTTSTSRTCALLSHTGAQYSAAEYTRDKEVRLCTKGATASPIYRSKSVPTALQTTPELQRFFGTELLRMPGDNAIDGLITESLVRVGQMQQILLPVPEDMLQEAWFLMGSYIIPLDSVTEGCRNHSSFLFESFLKREMWALKMVDAAGKPGAGILDGNIMSLGNYDECLSVSAPGGLFRGQQCIVETSGLLSPDAVSSFTPNGSGVHGYNSRGRENSMMAGAKVINRLPECIKELATKKRFKARLRDLFVSNAFYSSGEFMKKTLGSIKLFWKLLPK